MEKVAARRVQFGPYDAKPLLGVIALESVAIIVDPVTRILRRLPAVPVKSLAGEVLPCTALPDSALV